MIIFFIIAILLHIGLILNAQNRSLMPVPQSVTWGKNKFQISGAKVQASPDLYLREQKSIDQFIAFVKQYTGLSLSTTYSEDTNTHLIVLNSEQPGPALPLPKEKTGNQSREAYRITVTANKVQIDAKSDAGLYFALQTLCQLIINENKQHLYP